MPGSFMEHMMELADQYHIGGNFPFIPPIERRIQRMFDYCSIDPATSIAEGIGPTGKDITMRSIPILVAAFRAMANTRYNFLRSVMTAHPGGNLILVSGPLAKDMGIHGGQGCLEPGFIANATIRRAVNLVILNVGRSVPGYCDLDCIASQAELSHCFAQDSNLSPWKTINAESASTSSSP